MRAIQIVRVFFVWNALRKPTRYHFGFRGDLVGWVAHTNARLRSGEGLHQRL